MANVGEQLKTATVFLQKSGIAEPRREANSLLAFALGKDLSFLIAHPEYELSSDEEKRFRALIERRGAREPFQQIVGRQEFYGLDFVVTKDVLIPRPETELIVENAIAIMREKESPTFCEIGVGSGCISVSILHAVKTARGVAADVSEKALEIARLNAENNGVSARLDLKSSDVFAALKSEKFDLVVSNPPYIPLEDIETLQAEVKDFEPLIALTDGRDGLSIIKKIIAESPDFLKSGGHLLLEIGFDQAAQVREMFDLESWQSIEILPDLQGIPRMVKAQAKSEK